MPSQNPAAAVPPLQIKSVYLRNSRIEMVDGFDPTIPNQTLSGEFQAIGGRIDRVDAESDQVPPTKFTYFRFASSFQFRYFRENGNLAAEKDKDALVLAMISAEINVDYVATAAELPDHSFLESWGQTHALFHAWPYWREYCQNTLGRMALPLSIMPLLNPVLHNRTAEPSVNRARRARPKK